MMGQLSTITPSWRRAAGPWPRSRRRRWVRQDDGVSVTRLFAVIPSLPRAELARLTTRMIDRMDEIDGDPDLEPEEDRCPAGDDGCGPLYVRGQQVWGSDEGEHSPSTSAWQVPT